MYDAKLVIFNYVTLLIICAQKSARELVGFLTPNKFIIYPFTEIAKTDMTNLFPYYWSICWIQYPIYGSIPIIIMIVGHAGILCVWLK